MKTVIVVCRSIESLSWLDAVRMDLGRRIVVASDDPQVQARAMALKNVDSVVFLEKMESYYAVADEVIAILASLNEWLTTVGVQGGVAKDLLYWVSHCEGGDTTQRIQDALLLVHSYLELITRFDADEIVVVRSANADWEDTLLADCAKSMGIKVEWLGRLGARELVRRSWLKYRPLAKEVYFSLAVLRGWFRAIFRKPIAINCENLVVVQVCGSENKHLKNCLPLLAAIDAAGMEGVALCWGAGNASTAIRAHGLRAVDLETSVSLRILIESWVRTARTWFHARSLFGNLLTKLPVPVHATLIRPVMLESMRSFFYAEVAQRFRLDAASRDFFQRHPPRAASFWTRILPQGAIAFKAIAADRKPVIFWQPNPDHLIPNPYERYDVPVDLIFVASDVHKRRFATTTSPDSIFVIGLQWWTEIRNFQQMHSKESSRSRLGIVDSPVLCLMFDAGSVFRGYRTSEEILTVLNELIALAGRYPQIHLMIKPHPGHKAGLLEASIGRSPLRNITLIPKEESPFHGLNAADVLVTKFSTLIVEGLILGLPSVCVMLDGERRFSYVGDVADYKFTIQDFSEFVAKLTTDSEFRNRWYAQKRQSATAYLSAHAPQSGVNPYDAIANVIKIRLSCTS